MNEVNIAPFEFKIPAIPGRTLGNVIPTGKQIPRTPIKIEKENAQVEEHHNAATVVLPAEEPECRHNTTWSKKNCIPKGKEIPRTPIHKTSLVKSSSSESYSKSLLESDLGVKPLNECCENDYVDYKIEISILEGRINLRKNRPPKKDIDEETHTSVSGHRSVSKENKDCSKARSKGKSHKDTSEQLCQDMKTKCALVTSTQLQNISNQETSIRRNPSRRAKARVNYKL